MKHTWILLTGLFLLIAGCAQPPQPIPAPSLLTPPTFGIGWQFSTNDKSPIANMYCVGDHLFAYTETGISYVLDRHTGRLEQIDDVPAATGAMKSPAVMKDSIAYATADAVQIYDMHGNLTRTISLGYTLTSGIAGTKDMLFVAEAYPDGGRLAALDLNMIGGITYDPSFQKIAAVPRRWEYLVQHAGIISTPVVSKNGDAVYVAGEDGSVAALATSDREPIWPVDNGYFSCGGAVLADLALDDYGVYVASYDTELYCLNPNNGKKRWQYYAQSPLTDAPVATKDLVFQYVQGKGLVAIDKLSTADHHHKAPTFDRSPRWIAADGRKFLAEDNKYVFIFRKDGHIAALNKDTGAQEFVTKRSDFIAVAPNNNYDATTANHGNSTIYATLRGGTIVAINAVTLPGIIEPLACNNAPVAPGFAAARHDGSQPLAMAPGGVGAP